MNATIEKIKALNMLTGSINPTIIYNEGWMIKLLVIESMIEKLEIGGIDFDRFTNKNWSSEALIASPFVDAKKNREGYTHADIILGDFEIDYSERGEVKKKESAEILGIIEAKMGSNLSQSTTNAPDYNQASRNVCCLAHTTQNTDCETFFIITAPQKTIDKYNFKEQTAQIKTQIEKRFPLSGIDFDEKIRKKVDECTIAIISYEEWIEKIINYEVKSLLSVFYEKCKKYNKI